MIDFSQQKRESSEVYLAQQDSFSLERHDLSSLIQLAHHSSRQRVRFCSHASPQEVVHEMFIVHPKNTYVRPHKHLNKPESMLVLEGEVDYIIFDNSGNLKTSIAMGDYPSGKNFYQSIRTDLYHTLRIRSEWLVFLEITQGPFNKKDTVFAPWSPDDSDTKAVNNFIVNLEEILQ